MDKWMKIIGLIFLIFLVLILWTNYINPCPPPHTIFVDTCIVDTFGHSGIDTLKIDTTINK